MRKITINDLKEKKACNKGIVFYQENNLEDVDWDLIDEIKISNFSFAEWFVENFHLNIKISGFNGFWKKFKYDERNNKIRYEDSDGYWEKYEYNENNNKIYSKTSNGNWKKFEYDERNNKIHYKNSDKYWEKHEYDKNNNLIYSEYSDGCWKKHEYDERNNQIHYKNSDGNWKKFEYDERNNLIYYERSDGFWEKFEYDERNNQIRYEDSSGYWEKHEYDKNNNEIYNENFYGCREKYQYDENNNKIQNEYVEKNNEIDYEDLKNIKFEIIKKECVNENKFEIKIYDIFDELDEQILKEIYDEEWYGWCTRCTVLAIFIDGKLSQYYDDASEPEDAKLYRSFNWVINALNDAYKIGLKHGKNFGGIK